MVDPHSLTREELIHLVERLQRQVQILRRTGRPLMRARPRLDTKIQSWVADTLMPAIAKMSIQQRQVYIGEFTAIGKGLAQQLSLPEIVNDKLKLALAVAALITYEPDDDDDDEDGKPDLPKLGDLVKC